MMTWDEIDAYLLDFGSHERPREVYDMWERGGLPDDLLGQTVAAVWTARNERMADTLSAEEWVELFDYCQIPVVDGEGIVPQLPFVAYRAGHPDGMSWTTNRAVAERFAERGTRIYSCTVTVRGDLLAVLGDRNEAEVVLRPCGDWRQSVTLSPVSAATERLVTE